MTCHSACTSPLRLNRRSAFRRALRRCGGALFAALAVAVPLTCGAADAAPSDPEPPKLTIFAAASLKTALDEIAEAWRDRTGGALALSYAGSSALARQIEQGAPADLFVSANAAWMDRLDAAGLLREGSRRDVAGNALVLVAHRDGTDPAGDSAGDPAPETLAFCKKHGVVYHNLPWIPAQIELIRCLKDAALKMRASQAVENTEKKQV